MSKENFYIKNRKSRTVKHKKNFYVEYHLEEGKIYKSIDSLYLLLYGDDKHIASKSEAYVIADTALERGIVQSNKSKTLLVPFIQTFWDYDKSPYKKECDYEGKKRGRANFDKMLLTFNTYCLDIIPANLPYAGMTISILEEIKEALRNKDVSTSVYNKALGSIRQPLKYLYEKGRIPTNFADKIKGISQVNKKDTGIFDDREEAEKLIRHLKEKYLPNTYERWKYLVIALGYYSGMRQGEIRALKKSAIELKPDSAESIIHVDYTYSDDEDIKVKCTKGKEKRITFAPTPLCQEIINFLGFSPYPEGFIFFSAVKPEVPINKTTIAEATREAVREALNITEEERKQRNIKFHSFRHEFNTTLVYSGIAGDDIRSMTGHKSEAMTNHYTHTTKEGLEKLSQAVEKAIPYIE